MKALRFHGRGDLRLDQIDEPVCGKDQIKLKSEYVGICGTDLHEFLTGPMIIPATAHPLTGEKIPVTLGHEISATVVEVGSDVNRDDVEHLNPGDKVAVFPLLADNSCPSCLRGRPNCCASFGSIGFSGAGGLSETFLAARENVRKLPPNVDLEAGALAEPLTVAWHAVNRSSFQPGDDALVVGAGPVGLAVILVLKARGAGKVLVSELSPRRQQLARQFGADCVFDPRVAAAGQGREQHDPVRLCKDMCGDGEGPALVFDAAGVQAGLDLAFAASRPGASIVNIAVWETVPQVNSIALVTGEKKYIGTMVYLREDFDHVVDAMGSGALKPKGMITKVVSLDEAIDKGFKELLDSKENLVKVLIKVQSS